LCKLIGLNAEIFIGLLGGKSYEQNACEYFYDGASRRKIKPFRRVSSKNILC
jgi:hypothetical protein